LQERRVAYQLFTPSFDEDPLVQKVTLFSFAKALQSTNIFNPTKVHIKTACYLIPRSSAQTKSKAQSEREKARSLWCVFVLLMEMLGF